jgi:putative transposase
VTWAIEEKCYSQRRACGLVGLDPKTYRYASRRPDDAAVRARLKELALERRRFGYRRLHILLRREGLDLNHKKLFRLYREERLTVKKRGGRKRALWTRAPMALPAVDAGTHGAAAGTEPAVEPGLRVGHAGRRAAVPRPGGR